MRRLLLLITLCLSITVADAKKDKDADKRMDPQTEQILQQLSLRPELMNVNYLRYFIGMPEMPTQSNLTRNYYWYDNNRHQVYELHQREEPRGTIVESTFIAHLHVPKLTLDEIDKDYGNTGKHFYTNDLSIAEKFSFAPMATLTFTNSRNEFRVHRGIVEYQGPGLGQPSAEEMETAKEGLLNRALLLENQKNYAQAIPLLQATLAEHPNNGYAHLALANALANTGSVQPAADQYQAALVLSNGDDDLKQKSIQGLQSLHVMPMSDSQQPQYGDIKRQHHGQSLKALSPKNQKNAPGPDVQNDPLYQPVPLQPQPAQ